MITPNQWKMLAVPEPKFWVPVLAKLRDAARLLESGGACADHESLGNLEWRDDRGGLLIAPSNAAGWRLALHPVDLQLVLLDPQGSRAARFDLEGKSLMDAHAWMERNSRDADAIDEPITHLRETRPENAELAVRRELAGWFANARTLVAHAVRSEPLATPVRCSSENLKMAVVVRLDPGASTSAGRSVELGMCPGDNVHKAPYLYVRPSRIPMIRGLPGLNAGCHWQTHEWFGAVVRGAAIAQNRTPEEQAGFARRSLTRSLRVVLDLLHERPNSCT